MRKCINKTYIEGLVYDADLEIKTTGAGSKNPGTEFISGTISIATDNDCLNIVPVHYTYVTATTSSGKADSRYAYLKSVKEGTIGTVLNVGKEKAGKVRIDSAIGLNDFYTDRSGEVELVSAKRNEGGFLHAVPTLTEDEKKRATFEADMLITSVIHQDGDDEKKLQERAIVKGAIFDFRGALLPVEFVARNENAIAYFEGLDATSKTPVFTKVWGRQISSTVTNTYTEESAFGEAKVREVTNTRKDWLITGAAAEPYEWDDEGTITEEEVKKAAADRDLYLGTVKQRYIEYKESQKATASAPAAATGGFNF